MFSMLKTGLLSLSLGAGLLLVGCQSEGGAESSAAAMPGTKAVMCDKCATTWVSVPTKNDKGRVIGYSNKPEMVCKDCRDAVQSFLNTGQLKHTCAMCGGTMTACDSMPGQ